MDIHPYPTLKIGLIGGGQLARMMIYQGKKLGFAFSVLDPDPQAGAASLADEFIQGNLYDPKALRALSKTCDVLTYDIEHCGTGPLKDLEKEGFPIYPSPRLLELIQDKMIQKKTLMAAGIPMTAFVEKSLEDLGPQDFPIVQKTRTGGYDGRGVAVLKTPSDKGKFLQGETFFERFVPFEKELAVMVARSRDGETQVYPVVEMVFDPHLNICDAIHAPAAVPGLIAKNAQELAVKTVNVLDGVGVFGVELFLTKEGTLLVNEVAPRPHNSGHYTMETCSVCQFENHLRAVAGLPLGTPGFRGGAVMINLLGSGVGPSQIHGLDQALRVPGFSLHLYGKKDCRDGRKMGHFTVAGMDLGQALERAENIRQYLSIQGGANG